LLSARKKKYEKKKIRLMLPQHARKKDGKKKTKLMHSAHDKKM
jgi:hypothetical protein